MKKYLNKVKQCIKGFTTTQFQQITREQNVEANTLAKTTSVDEIVGDQIKVQYIPSIDIPEVNQIDGISNWTTLIVSYLKDELPPEDKEEATKLKGKAAKIVLMDKVSRPKPDTRICDHNWHANIKPKLILTRTNLTFTKLLPKASLLLFILVSLLK